MVDDRVREKETAIEKNFDSEKIRGAWDDEQLREVFVNLLANEIDASEPKSPVKISSEIVETDSRARSIEAPGRIRGERARILITDYGSGMDRKTQARL